ncbi:MAG TPA: hypothetical protein VGX25_05390 [Actinophytocola sp.]|uniref:hypothetical protein n=1 Tax=Actinophytocola sp. TaxID=1872138 RepID=UPI002DDD1076|nr:hypothetical protein [Actinophytocola sp.]HEV2778816.1 hypothetical protein [Actinophytocola sp.]
MHGRRVPAQAFTTHQVLSPSDRTIVTACEQAGCLAWRHGFDKPVDERTPVGQLQAELIRSGRSGRTYRELPGKTAEGYTVFRFAAGQRCFAEHRTRPELYIVHRGTPSQHLQTLRRHTRPDLFIEDYRETLDRRLTDIARRR